MVATKRKTAKRVPRSKHRALKILGWVGGVIVFLFLILVVAFRVSPAPGAFIISLVFDKDARQKQVALQAHAPTIPITVIANQQYISGDRDAFLDAYITTTALADDKKQPTIIWTHGGAWISGDKTNADVYFKLLAEQGFTVISLNYSLAPSQTYPTQIRQLNAAHAYIKENADRLLVDTNKILLAGDSAGAQLSSQLATIVTNPGYAQSVGIDPALTPDELDGVILFCGIYKMELLAHPHESLSRLVSWGTDVSVWAYTGTRDRDTPLIRQMSTYYQVNEDFPTTFISGGNGDPLTKVQSMPFAAKLLSLGVNVSTLFYDDEHQPSLPHEYQFVLDDDGRSALQATVDFAKRVSK